VGGAITTDDQVVVVSRIVPLKSMAWKKVAWPQSQGKGATDVPDSFGPQSEQITVLKPAKA